MTGNLTPYQRRFRDWMQRRGMRFQRTRYRREGDIWSTGYRLTPAGPPRARVVFVHGTGNEALYPQIGLFKRVLQRGVEVRAADLDGHGRRGTGTFDRERVRGAVPRMLARATTSAPGPVHAIGESLGAALLLDAVAGEEGAGVSSVTLISTPLRLYLGVATLAAEIAGLAGRRALRPRRHYGLLGSIPAFGPFRRSTFPVRVARRGRGFGYLEEVQHLLDDLDLPRAAASVRCPALLIAGDADRVVPRRHTDRLCVALPACERRVVAGGTHCTTSVALETEDAIVEWIERHTSA